MSRRAHPLLAVPIRYRLTLYSFLAGALIVALVVQQSTQSVENELINQGQDRRQTLVAIVTDISHDPLLTSEYSQGAELLGRMAVDEDIELIEVFDLSGQVVASSDSSRIGSFNDIEELTADAGSSSDVLTRPVVGASGQLGVVRVTFDNATLQLLLEHQRWHGVVAGLAGMILVAFISLIGGWAFTRRLSRLGSQLELVDASGVPEPVEIEGNDELAKIGHVLNRRRGAIKDGIESSSTTQAALRFSEARLQLALAAAAATVIEIDRSNSSFTIIGQSQLGSRLTELAAHSMEPLRDLVHPNDRGLVMGAVDRHLSDPSMPVEIEIRCKAIDPDRRKEHGGWRTMSIRAQSIESDGSSPQRVLMALIDVTDQRQSDRRTFHADKMRTIGQLTSGITHDFNNILSISTLTVGQLQKPDRDRERDAERIERLAKSNELATSMIKRLLLIAGPQSPLPEVIDVNEMIHRVGDLLASLLGERIEIEFDLAAGDASVLIDEARVQQVLLNLGQNAADAMGGEGLLAIHTSNVGSDQQTVQIVVSDTGTGIDPAVAASLFDPFVTTKSIGAGTGLGLATSYETITMAGGTISAANRSDGSGAVFTISLPRAIPEHNQAPVTDHDKAPPPSVFRLILAVEDHPEVLDSVATTLEVEGYRVITASSPSQALAVAAEQTHVDLLLTDVHLPEMTGVELSAILQTRHPEMRTLYMSGYVPDEANASITKADLLQKPFTTDQLLHRTALSLTGQPRAGV